MNNNITSKQKIYINKAREHIKYCVPQYIIDRYNLLRDVPTTKWEASKYITFVGEVCRKHQDELHDGYKQDDKRTFANNAFKYNIINDVEETYDELKIHDVI